MDYGKAAADIFNKYANDYQERFMDVSLYHHSLDLFCKNITKENASVFELACGPGNITKYLLTQKPDLQITGTDLAPNMVELAQKNNPTAKFEIMDCRNLSMLNNTYDAIMCGFCLPYFTKNEAIKLLEDCGKIINNTGVIYISTMVEDENNKTGFQTGSKGDSVLMNFHSADYLKSTLTQNGFNVIHELYQDFPNSEEKRYTDLILIAKKQ